jgi:Spy/CpxP family protein refolding chaperone
MFRLRVGLTLLSVALLGGLLLGQDKKAADPAPPPRAPLPQHFKKLGLTDEQTQAVRKVRGEYRAKIDRLRKEIADLQKEERMKYEQVLTPEQRARLRVLRAGEPATKEARPPAKDKAPRKDK